MNFVAPHVVRLTTAQAETLKAAAAQANPHECCGLLVGEGDAQISITEIVPTANVAENPRHAFAIDPQAQFDLLRATRDSLRRIVGHYHSHPGGTAVPSAHDLAMAYDPEAVWLLISAGEVRAYHRPEGTSGFVEVPITIS